MRNMRRRILCCVLFFLILFSLTPLPALAQGQVSDPVSSVSAEAGDPAPGTEAAASGSGDPLPEGNTPPEEDTPTDEDILPEGDILPEEDPPENGDRSEEPDGIPEDVSAGGLPDDSWSADASSAEAPGEDASDGSSEALASLKALIATLPAADEIAGMGEEELSNLNLLISRILDLYNALSEEEQSFADLSPLEALYTSFDTQALNYTAVSLTVDYPSDDTLKCGVPIKFTLKASDGVGPFKYAIDSIMYNTSSGVYFEQFRTNTYTSETYSKTYDFEYTFKTSGEYYFYANVMDMGVGTTVDVARYRVNLNINDPTHPSVDDMVEILYNKCMEDCPNGTEYEQALYYHDWIIEHAYYDDTLIYAGPGGVLCHGYGTCQSYYEAFKMLLDRSGIVSEKATGNGHIWTRVRLDGVWTLIDSTWDDKPEALLQHMYFGLTDELMRLDHTEHVTNPDHPCDSLERNYLILSGEIKTMSDPIRDAILALPAGNHTIPANTGNTIPDVYYKTLCPLAAYYLMTREPDLTNAGITVSYNAADKTYSVNVPCADSQHQLKSVPGTPATCTQTGLTEGSACSVCGKVLTAQQTLPMIFHAEVPVPGIPATCTQTGLTEGKKCSVCGTVTVAQQTVPLREHTPVTDPAVAPSGFTPGRTEGSHCSVCGQTLVPQREYFSETALFLPSDGLSGSSVWVDGVQLPAGAVTEKDGQICIELSRTDASSLVTYTYNTSSSDPHAVYPVGMKVWMLEYNGGYTAKYIPEFDDLLKYAGSSIRITGVKGIRMITGIRQDVKGALTGGGIGGYTLQEYGTVLAWASEVSATSLVLGAPGAKSNFAYKRDVADPVFSSGGGMIQYTNVLVGFNNDQCKADIVMRPYIVLRSASGRDITVYGGVVQRSIGYIASQNRSVFTPGSSAYNYVWDIIHHVYGNQFD